MFYHISSPFIFEEVVSKPFNLWVSLIGQPNVWPQLDGWLMQAATLENQTDKVQKDAWCKALLCSSTRCRVRLTKGRFWKHYSEIHKSFTHWLFSLWWSSNMCSCLLNFQEPDPSEQPQSKEKDCFQIKCTERKLSCFLMHFSWWLMEFFRCGSWSLAGLATNKGYSLSNLHPSQLVLRPFQGGYSDHRGAKRRLAGAANKNGGHSMRKWWCFWCFIGLQMILGRFAPKSRLGFATLLK